MKPIHQLFIAVLLLCAIQISAQTPIEVTFTPATSTVAVGANVAIQMRVMNFKNIATVQFPIVYNKDVLQLVSVSGPNAQLQNFHVDFADPDPNLASTPGKLAVSWNYNGGAQPNGATIAGNGTFFTLNFKVLTDCNSTVNLSGTASPTIDITNVSGQAVAVNYQNGAATITAGSCATNPPIVEGPIQGFHIIANSLYIPAGEVGCMPVTGNDFENIVSMTYAFKWDPLILNNVGSRDSRSNKLVPSNIDFGVFNATGRLALLWYTPTVPNTRADLSPLYELCYKAIGNSGTNSLVTPNGDGFNPPNPTEVLQKVGTADINIWKDTTGIKDTIYVQSNPAPSFAVAYIGERDSVLQNQVSCVDVRVKNFNNATYGEFAMTYDSLRLQFDHFNLGTNPLGLDTSTTSPTNIENFLKFQKLDIVNQNGDEQTLRYIQYAYRKAAGVTLPDNSVVFSACFKAIGAPSANGTSTEVKISSYLDPGNVLVPIGAAKKTFGSIPIAYTSGSVFIRSASVLAATTTVQNATCVGNNGSINLSVTNCTGTSTYNWTGPGITPANKTVQNPTGLSAGAYAVTVTCSTGGTTTASATITSPVAISLATTPTITSITCYSGTDGAISVAPTGGATPYTYAWAGPAGFVSVNSPNLTGLRASNLYKVTITDATGCAFISSALNVTEPAPIALPTAGMITNPVKCKGGSDGSITLPDANGGTAPYTYTWSGPGAYTATGKAITGLGIGSYTVVIKDAKNCSYTHNPLQITEPALALTVSNPTVTNVKCFNSNDGAIQINVEGGTGARTYSWRNTASNTMVSSSEDPVVLAAGTYALTVTDANLCTATSTVQTINGPASALQVTETHVDAACAGNPTGSIALNITGGWNSSAATVAWPAPLPPSGTLTNVASGTYVATVTDPGGCVVTMPVTIGSAPAITLGNYSSTNVACHGQATGGIVIFPTGGGTGTTYNVAWTGGLSGTSISNLAGGDYVATVTNLSSGCSAVFPAITITEPDPLVIVDSTIVAQDGNDNNGAIILDSISGGTPTYGYSWTGPNGFTSTDASINDLAGGDYLLTITDANLCILTAVINVNAINQDPLAGTTVASVKNACNNDGCIQLLIATTATAVPFTISWGASGSMVSTDYITDVCGLAPGVYNLTVTDAAGYTTTLPTQIVGQSAIAAVGNVINEPVDDAKNGSIVLNPVPAGSPLIYVWSNGSTASALVNIDSGTYIVTVTHQVSGCTAVYSYPVNRTYLPVTPVFGTLVNPGCVNSATGAIPFSFSGANGPNYQYSWTGPNGFTATTASINGLPAGTYNLTVTDESGTTFTYSRTLIAQSQLEVTNVSETSLYAGGYQVSAAAACDGRATVAFSGQSGTATIAWSNGINTATNITLCRGAYSVTVTDQLGCSSVWSDSLTAPQSVVAIVNPIGNVTCAGECDAIAEVSVVGGVAPYIVRWALPGNQFQTDQLPNSASYSIADNLCGGNYSVTVTDGTGTTTLATVTVTEPAVITATFNQNLPTRFNSCDAETMIIAQGANGLVNYTWSGNNGHSGDAARATGLCAGEIITFTIVDDKGCSAIARDTIAYPEGGCLAGSPVITPGEQDGKNDVLYITCAETIDNTVEIFNRWGQLVFNVENYDNNGVVWTGTTRSGATLPEGVYFYVMTYTDDQGTPQRIKGYVNLLR